MEISLSCILQFRRGYYMLASTKERILLTVDSHPQHSTVPSLLVSGRLEPVFCFYPLLRDLRCEVLCRRKYCQRGCSFSLLEPFFGLRSAQIQGSYVLDRAFALGRDKNNNHQRHSLGEKKIHLFEKERGEGERSNGDCLWDCEEVYIFYKPLQLSAPVSAILFQYRLWLKKPPEYQFPSANTSVRFFFSSETV